MKSVVITGVSRGLGRAMAMRFAAHDCIVTGCGRSQTCVANLQAEIGADHRISTVDVASDDAVAAWARASLEHCGPPDLLINNAAVINGNAPLWDVSADEFDRLTSVNINGTANVVRHFVPAMVDRSHGVIVNFSSGWGRSVSSDVAPYCASKWAIEGLTRALAEELPAGMAAVPLNPGVINTDMLQSCFGDGASMYPDADQWAAAAVPFLLQLSARDNGQPLTVPGM